MCLLAFNQFSCPPSRVNGSASVVTVASDFPDHLCDPISAEELSNLSAGESFSKVTATLLVRGHLRSENMKYVPKNTHSGSHQTLSLVRVSVNNRQEAEDGLDVGSETGSYKRTVNNESQR